MVCQSADTGLPDCKMWILKADFIFVILFGCEGFNLSCTSMCLYCNQLGL